MAFTQHAKEATKKVRAAHKGSKIVAKKTAPRAKSAYKSKAT